MPNTARSRPEREPEDIPPVPQVGRYLLIERLGQGGMGVVYSAYDPDLDRKVALKLLQADGQADSQGGRVRLLREAQAMARISHPNVVPIFDVGIWGEQVFLAMELADGGSLSGWLDDEDEDHSWREVLERFLGAGRGLQAAHAVGLVHRDFKPANVLVSQSGRVWVTDFGLARPVDPDAPEEEVPESVQELAPNSRRVLNDQLTQAGVVVGTPNYMSPEQYIGGGLELDARSDQFSFCVSLYWALYRQRAFETARMRTFAAAHRRQATPEDRTAPMKPSALTKLSDVPTDLIREPPRDANVPGWIRQALMRGMAVNPSERFPSMEELLEALSQERRRAARRKWLAAACATGVGLAAVGGFAYQRSQVCAGIDGLMAQVWTPEAQGQLASSFAATGRPIAQETAVHVTQVLGDYAKSWTQQRFQVCQATHSSAVAQPEELLGRRVACLERRREDLRALVGLLTQADGPLVEKAVDAAHALPDLAECADLEGLAEQQRLPSDPGKREEIARLGTGLAEVKALVDGGRYKVRAAEGPGARGGGDGHGLPAPAVRAALPPGLVAEATGPGPRVRGAARALRLRRRGRTGRQAQGGRAHQAALRGEGREALRSGPGLGGAGRGHAAAAGR